MCFRKLTIIINKCTLYTYRRLVLCAVAGVSYKGGVAARRYPDGQTFGIAECGLTWQRSRRPQQKSHMDLFRIHLFHYILIYWQFVNSNLPLKTNLFRSALYIMNVRNIMCTKINLVKPNMIGAHEIVIEGKNWG